MIIVHKVNYMQEEINIGTGSQITAEPEYYEVMKKYNSPNDSSAN